ncbi:MAG: PqqD family protein [Chloroflexota bacterium]
MTSAIPHQKPDYRLEQLDDELLLYHPTRTSIMYCNETASIIWHLCDGQRTTEEIVSLLSAAYEQPPETVLADVDAVLCQFYEHQAIEYLDANGQVVEIPQQKSP